MWQYPSTEKKRRISWFTRSTEDAKTISRRDAMKLALAGGAVIAFPACRSRPSHEAAVNAATRARFQAALPIPPVLQPARSDGQGDYYEIEARESTAAILPGKQTDLGNTTGSFLDRRFKPPEDERPTSDLQASSTLR